MNTMRGYKEGDRLGGHDPYSSSKAAIELIVASYVKSFFNPDTYGVSHHTLVASARAGNIIGGGDWSKDRIIPDFVKALFEENRSLVIRNPKATRPWQHVLQPLSGYLLLAKKLYTGDKQTSGPWNFGPSKKNHIQVDKVLGFAIKHLQKGSFTVSADYKKHETLFLSLDSAKAKKYLGWHGAVSVKDSIRWTLDWYKNFYNKSDIVGFTGSQIKFFFKNVL